MESSRHLFTSPMATRSSQTILWIKQRPFGLVGREVSRPIVYLEGPVQQQKLQPCNPPSEMRGRKRSIAHVSVNHKSPFPPQELHLCGISKDLDSFPHTHPGKAFPSRLLWEQRTSICLHPGEKVAANKRSWSKTEL